MSKLDRRFFEVSLTVLGVANEPEENPSNGDQYIVGSSATGAFEGATENYIARYNGTSWVFRAPGSFEVLNSATNKILKFNGSGCEVVADFNSFIVPVLDIVPTGDELPATCSEGEVFLNTSDNKLYTATGEDTWNGGVSLSDGARYASSEDFKIYQSDGTDVAGLAVVDGGIFLNKGDGNIYIYDATAGAFRRNGADVTVTERHTLNAAEVSAKSFSLSHPVATGREAQVMLSIGGVAQLAGTDFSVSGSTVSWNGLGLDNIGLVEGDVFVVHYVKA